MTNNIPKLQRKKNAMQYVYNTTNKNTKKLESFKIKNIQKCRVLGKLGMVPGKYKKKCETPSYGHNERKKKRCKQLAGGTHSAPTLCSAISRRVRGWWARSTTPPCNSCSSRRLAASNPPAAFGLKVDQTLLLTGWNSLPGDFKQRLVLGHMNFALRV